MRAASSDATCTTKCPTSGVPGRFGLAIQFDGTASQAISVTNTTVPTQSLTLGEWFENDLHELRYFIVRDP